MRRYIFFFFLVLALTGKAQTHQQLRDSLKAAIATLSFHPDSIDLRLKKAAWNLELEEWRIASDEYDVVLRLQPANPAALYFRAYANERQGRYNFARIDYENLLRIVPGNFEAQLGLALLNEKDKHYTEAYDGINRLVAAFPDSALAYAARAGIEKEHHMLELAEYDYAEAIRRDGSNVDYRLAHADVLIDLRRVVDARRELGQLEAMGMSRGQLRDLYKRLRAIGK